jgi:hypothetical protein
VRDRPAISPCYPPAVRLVNILAIIVVLMAAACSGAESSVPPEQTLIVVTPSPAPTEESFPPEPPLITPGPDGSFPSEPPLVTPEPGESAPPDESFPPEPPLITPGPGTSGPVTACSDNVSEQDFYAKVVAVVDWDVYCPGLPAGWRLQAGTYRLPGDGFLEISYVDRSGASLELGEGAFCDQADGCVPAGEDVGATPFGDRVATLVAGADGSWAIVVDRGAEVSWVLIGRSIDEASFRAIAAGMIRVEP